MPSFYLTVNDAVRAKIDELVESKGLDAKDYPYSSDAAFSLNQLSAILGGSGNSQSIADSIGEVLKNVGGSSGGSGLDGYKLIDGTLDGELVIPAGKTDKITDFGLAGISVTKIDLKDSGVKNIGEGGFSNDRNLTEIVMPDSLETIGGNCFWGCWSITDIDFNSSVTINPYYTFAGCSKLVKVPILTITTDDIMVRNYTDTTFAGCNKLKKVIITNAKVIGKETFSGCTSLEYLYIGPTVTTIESRAFSGVPVTCKVRCGFSEGAISGFPANGGWAGNPNDLDIEYDVPVPTEYPED